MKKDYEIIGSGRGKTIIFPGGVSLQKFNKCIAKEFPGVPRAKILVVGAFYAGSREEIRIYRIS